VDVGVAIDALEKLIDWCDRVSPANVPGEPTGKTNSDQPTEMNRNWPPSHIDAEAARELLVHGELLLAAAGWKATSAAREMIRQLRRMERDDKELVLRNSPEVLGVFARTAIKPLEDLEKATLDSYEPSRFIRCIGRILMDIPDPPGHRAPTSPSAPISVHEAICFLQQVAAWGKPGLRTGGELDSAVHVPDSDNDEKDKEVRHSTDFRSAYWYGQTFAFTANQAACVRIWWEHWERGTPDVGDATVLEITEIQNGRIDLVFRGHDAWGTMIMPGTTKGTHRLKEPGS
jgi:hypothetical protein